VQAAPADIRRLKTAYRLTIGRRILVIALGVLLFVQPEKTQQSLANFIGIFWFAEGILTLRAVFSVRPLRKLGLYAGITATIFGALMVTSALGLEWLPEDLLFGLAGAIMVLTGLLHILGGFRADDRSRAARIGRALFGILQMVLGLLIIVSRSGLSPAVYLAASLWAFLSGFLLILAALRLRAAMQGLDAPS
jgi:uncharacterized membrane protein HdeD (DUF308 family)